MYQQLYNVGIRSYGLSIRLAQYFNAKAKSWVAGREGIYRNLKTSITKGDSILWFHAASLGEAEQGVPVMQQLKREFPDKKILLTFFSPSGMDHFKNNGLADYIFYLPLDTKANAKRFLDAVKPELAFFIKYEIWPNFFKQIQKRNIPLIIAPAIFRADQFYFKAPHRSFFLPILQKVNSILVQDENSKKVLNENGVTHVQVCGDSRFDRVKQNVATPFENVVLEEFSKGQKVLIGGSTWSPGETILKEVLEQNPELKMILAPHDIRPENIQRILKLFGKDAFAYSKPPGNFTNYRVCIIDNIGLLSRLYRFGQMAYIGGAFGKGIHNSLEAAAYGLPLFFGPNHTAFIEPAEMIAEGFAFEINRAADLQTFLKPLLESETQLNKLRAKALDYVDRKAGAVEMIAGEVRALLKK
jgi:3-deoxy-D-manno-octulosonic-acid transferase